MKQQKYVAQRPGCKDCEIASLATITGRSYEEIAGSIAIDCSNGERVSLDNIEIHNAVILTRL